ncbi:MAG: HlyD family efflux transporter periplasmic adaptor subunit [Verrucomicrobiota bacterium]|nr:HlyD family efflux transporter periplasmic adaptor subunit [Verrucomicrobiota bacterium]
MNIKRRIPSKSNEKGSALGKILGILCVVGLVGGGVWGSKYLLSKEEEKVRQEKYWTAEKSDFLVTVKLTGRLAATDVVELKCQLEGSTTIESIVEEGTEVEGPFRYTIQADDTLASIAADTSKDELSIRLLNSVEDIDWDNLPEGQSIMIPGDLLVELDPLNLKERINQMEIVVEKSENALLRMIGNLKNTELSAAFALKVAENNHKLAVMAQEKALNSTIKNQIKSDMGSITNLANQVEESREQMAISEAKLKWYKQLEEKQFLSKMKLREEQLKLQREKNNAEQLRHQIAMAKARLDAYKKYDSVSILNQSELAVDEALVSIEKVKVRNIADLRDANSTIATQEKTFDLENERLEDLKEQMAATRIYAPADGTVVYFSESYKEYGPIMDGARVHRGRNLIKLPKTKSLKVELNVPQAKRGLLTRGMGAWVQVEDVTLPGTLSVLGTTVDTNRRGHTEKSYFKGEVYIDNNDFPDSVSEGMTVTVEIKVINLEGENQRIKVPNQCVTTRMISEDTAQTGCYVLDPVTKKHKWRPVTIEYSDENFIAIKEETEPGRGLQVGELVHLSPLTEAENLNLEEAVMDKGRVALGTPGSGKALNAKGENNEPVDFGLSDEQREKWEAAQAEATGEITEVIKKIQSREIPEENAVSTLSKAFESSRAKVGKFLNEDQLEKYDMWIIPAKLAAKGRVKRFLSPKSSLGKSVGSKQRRSRE